MPAELLAHSCTFSLFVLQPEFDQPMSSRRFGKAPDEWEMGWYLPSRSLTHGWGHLGSNHPLVATIPVTEHIKDELDSAGNSQLFEDSVDVVPDRMFLHPEPLSDFAVFHAISDEADYIFLATRQQGHSIGVV